MSRTMAVLSVLVVVLMAMGFAAVNAGHRVNLSLGFVFLYQVPVAFVAFFGLFVGMLLMFATGVHSDLKVRRILRDRLADEAQREQTWIDRNQKDMFADEKEEEAGEEKEGEGGAHGTERLELAPSPAPKEGELMEE